ncbi:MAG TPA: YitT family protein, partial [Chitinophagaceae bacterium]
MNPLLSNIILSAARKTTAQKERRRNSPYRRDARQRYRTRRGRYTVVRDALFLLAGIFCAGFGLNGFLIPNKFIDGGVTGISLMLRQLTIIPFPVWLVLVNVPFIFLAFTQVSRLFALKTALAIIGLAICVAVVNYPVMTQDKLLIPVFGGFFLGAGIGLAVRGGGVLDGTEVLAIYLSKKTNLSIGDIILIFNILIFVVANFLLGTNIALYAIITYF